jgi:phosphoglycolate phosphatase-like HAD superfamily hydrolase
MNQKLLLFDIDGTLVRTGGAGRRAMDLAFGELFTIDNGLDAVEMAGRIDVAIFRAALVKHGLATVDFDNQVRRFRDVYCHHLAVTLKETKGAMLPGVRELLTALRPRPDVRIGLATGNFRKGAETKLSYYGLWHFFEGGAFGDDCQERGALVAEAIRNMRDGPRSSGDTVYVIGDTVHDIRAAKANSAIAVAVATGGMQSRAEAAEELLACGPDLFFSDLSDWRGVLAALGLPLLGE